MKEELVVREIEKQRKKEEAAERKKEKAWYAKEREQEKERKAKESQEEKEYIASISIESVMKKKVGAASFGDLGIFADKINKEIKRVSQLKETPEKQDEILKMKERVTEIQTEVYARVKERGRKEARRIEKKELKITIKKAVQELKAAQESLVKIHAFHLLRTQEQKEKQVQDQEKIVRTNEARISEMNAKLSDND